MSIHLLSSRSWTPRTTSTPALTDRTAASEVLVYCWPLSDFGDHDALKAELVP